MHALVIVETIFNKMLKVDLKMAMSMELEIKFKSKSLD